MHLFYHCEPSADAFATLARQAAEQWNTTLSGLVVLTEWVFNPTLPPNITISLDDGATVRSPMNPTRVAQCRRDGHYEWSIDLSAAVRWDITGWQRFWGRNENALAALVHEMGHVFRLPHSANPLDVMHPEIGGSGKLGKAERARYRAKYLQIIESEA